MKLEFPILISNPQCCSHKGKWDSRVYSEQSAVYAV